jgi:uncharacterized protein (TIGR02246 family)
MQRFLSTVSVGLILITAGISSAQDTGTAGQRPIPQIRKLLTAVEESFSHGDAKGLAACWTANGDFSGPAGERAEGRENIETAFRKFFATHKGSTMKLKVASLRLASEDLALLDVISAVKHAGAQDASESTLSLVLVKRDNRWLIESAREAAAPSPSPVQHLKEMEWMLGDWADEASQQNGISVHSTCDWTANQAFLIRKFQVAGRADITRTGTEIIGWDPRAQRIRSWVFDSDGGFGENVWVRDGNRWLVRYSGTRPDGSEVSATNILTVVDADTIMFQSKGRTVDGERQPEVPEITIKRQRVAQSGANTKEPAKPPRRVLP